MPEKLWHIEQIGDSGRILPLTVYKPFASRRQIVWSVALLQNNNLSFLSPRHIVGGRYQYYHPSMHDDGPPRKEGTRETSS